MTHKILVALAMLSLGISIAVPSVALAQTITSISPSSVPVGSEDTTLTVTGTGFQNGSKIRFNGDDMDTTFVSSTRLTAMIEADTLDEEEQFEVTVINPDGSESNAVAFFVTQTPDFPQTGFGPAEQNPWVTAGIWALIVLSVIAALWGIKKIYDAMVIKK